MYDVEHPDITATLRTGYPLGCGESPLMPTLKDFDGEFPLTFDEGEDD